MLLDFCVCFFLQIKQTDLPVQQTWRLNERHYGGLTGLNKAETAEKHGEEQVCPDEHDKMDDKIGVTLTLSLQVQIWRRSFDTPPPPMDPKHPFYDTIVKDPRYKV